MDELDRGLAIAMTGPARDAALAACRRQIATWNVALPRVEPLVLDFGLATFEQTGLIEFWIANEANAGYCGKYMFVFDGQTCPQHRHRTKHETFFVVKGRLQMQCGARTFELGEGDVLPVTPGVWHSFTGLGPALLLELSMPCEIDDNEFADLRITVSVKPPPKDT